MGKYSVWMFFRSVSNTNIPFWLACAQSWQSAFFPSSQSASVPVSPINPDIRLVQLTCINQHFGETRLAIVSRSNPFHPITFGGPTSFTDETFVAMVLSRWRFEGSHVTGSVSQYPARLTTVDVELNDVLDENAARVLKECVDAGLDFSRWMNMASFNMELPGQFVCKVMFKFASL
jgi:hypothetical protein